MTDTTEETPILFGVGNDQAALAELLAQYAETAADVEVPLVEFLGAIIAGYDCWLTARLGALAPSARQEANSITVSILVNTGVDEDKFTYVVDDDQNRVDYERDEAQDSGSFDVVL